MDTTCDENRQDCRLSSCLFFSSAKLARVFGKIAEDAFQKIGLSPSHALILYLVNQRSSIHQKEIGELLHLTPSTITRFVEKLENKKLIFRKNDGKNVYIGSTEEGLLLQSDLIKAWNDLHAKYEDILTGEETEQFIALCGKLLKKLEHPQD